MALLLRTSLYELYRLDYSVGKPSFSTSPFGLSRNTKVPLRIRI